MNNTVRFIDSVKKNLILTYEEYENYSYNDSNFDFNKYISDSDYLKARMILRKLSKENEIELPETYEVNRSIKELFQDISYASGYSHQNTAGRIAMIFNKYSTYLEDNLYEVEIVKVECEIPKELTYRGIQSDLLKCETRISDGDFAGAITSAKTLVEGVCKEILVIKGIDPISDTDSLPKLYTDLTKQLNLNSANPKLDNSLKEITSGLNKVIKGLAEVRNLSGDSHAKISTPSFHHAVLAVNAAKTVTSFLFHTYEYQKDREKITKV